MRDQLSRIPTDEKAQAYENHALPDEWEHMEYHEFLMKRRVLMAQVIRKGFERL